jgi:hypothetical protein
MRKFALKMHKWEFALLISVVNIFAGYVVPYLVGYFLSGLWETITNSLITLALNVLVIILSIEEQNAPDLSSVLESTNTTRKFWLQLRTETEPQTRILMNGFLRGLDMRCKACGAMYPYHFEGGSPESARMCTADTEAKEVALTKVE